MAAEITDYYKLFELKRSDDLAAIQASLAELKEVFGGIWDSEEEDEADDQLYICLLEAEQVFSTEGNRVGYDRALDSVFGPPAAEVKSPEPPAPKAAPAPAPQPVPVPPPQPPRPQMSEERSSPSTDPGLKPEPRQMSRVEEQLVARLSEARKGKRDSAERVRNLQTIRRRWRIFALLFLIPAVHFYRVGHELHSQGDIDASTFPTVLFILSVFAFLGIMFNPPFTEDWKRAKDSLKVPTELVSDLEAELAEERERGES